MNNTLNDLQQYYDIVNATIEFRAEHFDGKNAFKGYNPIEDYYKQEKAAAAVYFSGGNLEMLKDQFEKLTSSLANHHQENFSNYLKHKTGFVIDVAND